jgi:subtilisin family serine protease
MGNYACYRKDKFKQQCELEYELYHTLVMKNKLKLLGLLSFLVCFNSFAQTPHFYYFGGERQYFELDTRYVFVSVTDEITATTLMSNSASFLPWRVDIPEGKRAESNQSKRFWTILNLEDNLSGEAYLATLNEIRSVENNVVVAPFFKNRYQDRIGLSNFLYVKLWEISDTALLRQEAEKEHAVVVYQSAVHLWFVLSVTERSKFNAMELANHFFESGLFQYAEPDLIGAVSFACANDQRFEQQWGLKNTGQGGGVAGIDIRACDAWRISTGSGIVVAIVDQGIDSTHPDLTANMHPFSYDTETRTSPQRVRGRHGTPCAGIVGAIKNNTIGIAGVAPNSRIMAISNCVAGPPLGHEGMAAGITWAWRNGADVISNSWNTGIVPSQIIADAIDSAVRYGRDGKGSVVVFSSGNDNRGSLNYPARFSNVIAVGAIDRNGRRASFPDWGSNYGTNLDIVAPGVDIYTTYWQRGEYYYFQRTSAAAPHVAGVAALILSVRPDLTQAQVRHAIESTAQKLSNYTFVQNHNYPNGTWNDFVGHGLVDAYAAVKNAVFGSVLPTISGYPIICTTSVFSMGVSGFQATYWSVDPEAFFTITDSNATSATVVATSLNGQTGTITAVVNGVPITKIIQACNLVDILAISGPIAVCPGTTGIEFSVQNLPVDATIQWTHGRDLAIVGPSNQATVRINNTKGLPFFDMLSEPIPFDPSTSWIGAQVNINGQTRPLWHSLTVDRVLLSPIQAEIPPKGGYQTRIWYRFTCLHGRQESLSWAVNPNASVSVINSTQADIRFIATGLHTTTASITNACGTSSVQTAIHVSGSFELPSCLICGPGFICRCLIIGGIFSPNPVNDVLTIDLTLVKIPDSYDAQSSSKTIFDARLLNAQGVIVRQQQTQASSIQFDVSNLPEGTYYLHIEHNGKIEKHQIIVQRN